GLFERGDFFFSGMMCNPHPNMQHNTDQVALIYDFRWVINSTTQINVSLYQTAAMLPICCI
ncbi:MAG TPA: hypothetical protein VHK86_02170, partial [Nitrososphaera sp.]|nr:hypothetical protein [Nitrososphaera sp.]